MIGITHTFCIIFGMIIMVLAYLFMQWGFYYFEQWLKSRKGQGKKKYIVKKKIKKGKCL